MRAFVKGDETERAREAKAMAMAPCIEALIRHDFVATPSPAWREKGSA
jgi:hypothetical protein